MATSTTGTRVTYAMIFAVLAGFAAILIMNTAAFFGVVPSRYISPNEVRGIAVEHNNKLYTLNFEQQNEFIDILNRSIPIGKELVEKRKVTVSNPPDVQKIIIYRFDAPDVEIKPVAYISKTLSQTENQKDNLVYAVLEWNEFGLLQESTSDELNKLLHTTYGP